MWRRALFVMGLSAGVIGAACGDETFSGAPTDDAGADASDGSIVDGGNLDASNDGSTDDGATDGSTSSDGSVGLIPIISGQNNPHDIFARDGRLYWTNYAENDAGGALMRANIDGTNVQPIAKGHHPNRLTPDNINVFWTDFDNPDAPGSYVYETPLVGGSTSVVASVTAPMGLAVDLNYVYVAEFYKLGPLGAIIEVSRSGAPTRFLAQHLDSPVSIALAGSGLVFTEVGTGPNGGKVTSIDADGGVLAQQTGLQGTWGVVNSASSAFSTAIDSPTSSNVGRIYGTPLVGDAGPTILFDNEGARPYFIAPDEANICWTTEGDGPSNGTVRCGAQFMPSGAVSIATGQARPHGIAVDTTYVYWTSYSTGKIYRAPKP